MALQTLAPLTGLEPLQSFDDLWTKIAVGTGQVSQSQIDAAKATSNSAAPTQTPAATTTQEHSTTSYGGFVMPDWTKYVAPLVGVLPGSANNYIADKLTPAEHFIFTSRLMFLIIGLILIAAGLFSFKTTQTVIQTGTKVAKTGAKIAAAIP